MRKSINIAIIYHFIVPFLATGLVGCVISSANPLNITYFYTKCCIYMSYFDFRFVLNISKLFYSEHLCTCNFRRYLASKCHKEKKENLSNIDINVKLGYSVLVTLKTILQTYDVKQNIYKHSPYTCIYQSLFFP